MSRFKSLTFILSLALLSGCASICPPSKLSSINSSTQVLSVYPIDTIHARLILWEKENDVWKRRYGPISAVVGRSGIAKAGEKREGDGHTPSGIFDLPFAFGYNPSIQTKLLYRQATSQDFWVDDINSPQYNQWVTSKPKQGSFEVLKRNDILYHDAIVIGYNTEPIIKGNGSAIFLHIWRGYNKSTSGCVAINQRHLHKLLKQLDKTKNPQIIIEDKIYFKS